MAKRQNFQSRLVRIAHSTALTFVLAVSCPALADGVNNNLIPTAISIAKQIEEQSLVETDPSHELIDPKTSSEAINQIIDVSTSGDPERIKMVLEKFENFLKTNDSLSDEKIFTLYKNYFNSGDITVTNSSYEQRRDFLLNSADDSDWYVSFHAKRLLSLTHSNSRQGDLALKAAQEALALIPNVLSDETINARIIATELIAYLQNLKANKDLALINTQRLIDLKLEADQTIDGIELLNNLMYSLSAWRDNEARLELAQTLKRLEDKYGSTTPGLTNMHISRVYVDIGEYEKAIPAALAAIEEAKIDSLKQIATINLATAYAGLGNVKEARKLLKSLPQESQGRFSIPYAETVIALQEGRIDDALKLMNERYDSRVRGFLEERSNNTMEMLATLANSSERQAEREAALKREQALIQTRLEQQQDINKLLLALIALIGLSGLAALLFARHRGQLAKQLAIKSKEAESADRMKTEFLGMVSHELRTPLNGIIGIADILADQGPTDQVRERGNIILSSGNVLFSMIESIIDMSRIDSDKLELVPEPVSITDIIGELRDEWQIEASKKNVTFTAHISQNCPERMELDSKYTRKLIDTLLSNAVKFTEKGRVHLHVTAERNDADENATIKVIVADTGQGISETVQEKLFKPFLQADSSMTRKYGGSGLRLAIARSIARMMDGDITLNSREGRGSEFTLTFKAPLSKIDMAPALDDAEDIETNKGLLVPEINQQASQSMETEDDSVFKMIELVIDKTSQENPNENLIAEEANKQPVKDDKNTPSLKGQRVLIVEDTPSNQDVVEMLLMAEGMSCVSVSSGKDALMALTRHYFDYVIMDIRMPDMDGVETTRRIRNSGEAWANVPIIALTADIAAENNAACMAAGTDIFLTKPVLARELKDAIIFLHDQRKESDGKPVLLLQDIA
jgi:signal transduction histidine kinase/ActR/RegA family two-component response regulator